MSGFKLNLWCSFSWLAVAGLLAACHQSDEPNIVTEETPLSNGSARAANRTPGQIILAATEIAGAPQGQQDVQAFRLLEDLSSGSGTLGNIQSVRLHVTETFYSKALELSALMRAGGGRRVQTYTGLGTVTWRTADEDGNEQNYSSIADVRAVQRYTVSHLIEGVEPATNCSDSTALSNEEQAACNELTGLPCYEAGDDFNLICIHITGTMFNPLPDRFPDIEITGKTTDPIRDTDPSRFSSENMMLVTRRMNGPIAFRAPSIHTLPLTRRIQGNLDRLRFRTALDAGTVQITDITLFVTNNLTAPTTSFLAINAGDWNPQTGLVEACLEGNLVGATPTSVFTGPLRFFWAVDYSFAGVTQTLDSDIQTVNVGTDVPLTERCG